jgi:hypothetical protein
MADSETLVHIAIALESIAKNMNWITFLLMVMLLFKSMNSNTKLEEILIVLKKLIK